MTISICVATYRRPEGLKRLLGGLNSLQFDAPEPEVALVVVDNDTAGSADAVCAVARPTFRWPIECVVEARRGIAHARNRALSRLAPGTAWVAFIDDDEVPDPRWLAELLATQRATGADVVAGPVVPFFPDPVEPWIESGGFFQPRRFEDGAAIPHAFTGNVLIRASLLEDPRLRPAFADRYALVGGEDRQFFERVRHAGYRQHWAARAVATEWVPSSRTNARWLIRRQFRVGNALAFIEGETLSGAGSRLRRFARALVELLRATASLPKARLGGPVAWLRGRQRMAASLGMFWGLLGRASEEYRDVHAA
jgi:glycosyltransferase involved in cell wall biosynthesis